MRTEQVEITWFNSLKELPNDIYTVAFRNLYTTSLTLGYYDPEKQQWFT